jgi:DNA-binding NarL/FixJ family response regulator
MRSSSAPRPRRHRVYLVEDHPLTMRGLVDLFNEQPDLQVCGHAKRAAAGLEGMKKLKPDLALVDLSLPRRSGLSLVKDIGTWLPKVRVLVLSMHDEMLYAERVLKAGAHGYIMKDKSPEELLRAVRRVLAGETYVSDAVARGIVESFAGRRRPGGTGLVGQLTDREFDVFQLVGQGMSAAEIGRRLRLSPKTVDTHRQHIKEKLRLRSLPELQLYAVRWAATERLL